MTDKELRDYRIAHKWRLRHRSKSGVCICCKSKRRTEWASRRKVYAKDDEKEWYELCRPCHDFYDNRTYRTAKPFRSVIPPHNIIYPYEHNPM